jgi:hypothetical protein
MPPRERRRRGGCASHWRCGSASSRPSPPLARVIHSGPWLWGAIALVRAARARLRAAPPALPVIVVTIVEVAAWTGAVTAVFFPANALLGVIPTGGVVEALPG